MQEICSGLALTGECPAVVGGGGEDVITRGVQGQAGHRALVHRQHLGEKGTGSRDLHAEEIE